MRGEQATRLAKCFSKGVIKVLKDKDGEKYAKVAHPRRDTCSREVLRHEVCEETQNALWQWLVSECAIVGPEGLCTVVTSKGSLYMYVNSIVGNPGNPL